MPLRAAGRPEVRHAGCDTGGQPSQERTDMPALIAGYATAIGALLFAAAVAFTIIRNVNRFASIDDQHEEPARKAAA
jgi:hypothetical protein